MFHYGGDMAQGKQLEREISETGAFVRQENRFTVPFGNGEGELPVEAGRYRLIWSRACPWATRQTIVLSLLGLDEAIGIGTVDPIRPAADRADWAFTLDPGGVDPVLKIRLLSEAYKKADPAYGGRNTVPAVVDLTTGKVVNNDYHRLTNYWETVWKSFHKPGAPDLYPENLRPAIDALNAVIFRDVNNGVYRAGFARSQAAYEDAYNAVFTRLDELETRLDGDRYLFGDILTDSDVRLYVTLVRFDAAYYSIFRCNKKRIHDYPNLWRYTRDLYGIPAFGGNTDFGHIKKHYHLCCDPGNVYRILPKGPDEKDWVESA
jgi:putative glutathione S-transferase